MKPLEFEGYGRYEAAALVGSPITSDAGSLLLLQVEQHLSLFDRVADCFSGHREPNRIQHSLRTPKSWSRQRRGWPKPRC